MAFTDVEKSKMLFYLGYSIFEDDGPAIRAINGLDSKEPRCGFIVRDLLEKMDDLRVKIHETIPLAQAVEDGSIKVRAHYTLDHLWRLGRQYANQLARLIKVSISGDVFSTSSDSRDHASFYSGDPSENRIDPNYGVPTKY